MVPEMPTAPLPWGDPLCGTGASMTQASDVALDAAALRKWMLVSKRTGSAPGVRRSTH